MFVEVINANDDIKKGILAPWIVFFSIASLVSICALSLKIRMFVEQVRERRSTIIDAIGEQTAYHRKLRAHKKKLVKTKRQVKLLYSSMMVGAAECVPLGILQSMLHGVLHACRAGYELTTFCLVDAGSRLLAAHG